MANDSYEFINCKFSQAEPSTELPWSNNYPGLAKQFRLIATEFIAVRWDFLIGSKYIPEQSHELSSGLTGIPSESLLFRLQ